MFEKILRFFLENYKINYTIFFLLFALGIYSYSKIPKEISPVIEPNSIAIRGSYSGTSVDTLNNMAVIPIENEVKNIIGVQNVNTIVSPGKFSIVLELEKNADKTKVIASTQDALSLVEVNLPADMITPTIRSVAHSRSIMHLSIISSKVSRAKLKTLANEIKTKITSMKDISDVTIFGNSKLYYEVLIDEKKVDAYGLSLSEIIKVFSELSYIYPLGKISNAKEQFFITTKNLPHFSSNIEDTIITIDNQQIRLKEIAKVTKKYEDASTLASVNAHNSITLAISQNPKGDAISIANEIKNFIAQQTIKDVAFNIKMDKTVLIKDRLNTVISNILLGILLITLLTAVLINLRIALVIALGIPTSFIIGAIYFYITGNSININSLVGVLIAIGIIVDDAIVVSENIQQYIEKGYSPKEAALLGTKEVAKPVTIASITTIFSFIPLLMLSGKLGEIVALIPIAFSALVIASLLESFIFLPIHASHILGTNSKTLSWHRAQKVYQKILHTVFTYQKIFLTLFMIFIPLLLLYFVQHSRFQLFQSFDSATINITFKANTNTTLQDSLKIVQTIEKDILDKQNLFFVKDISSTAGYRRTPTGVTQMYPYVGYISLELYKAKPQNFVEKYITPYLSFYYDSHGRIRQDSSKDIAQKLRLFLKEKKYKEHFKLHDLAVVEKSMGHTKADIRIGVISHNHKKAIQAVQEIKNTLSQINGIKYFGDNINLGRDEIRLAINNYGQQLGITQKYLGEYVSNLYLSKKIGTLFDGNELLDIKIKSVNYEDTLQNFKNLEIPLKDKSVVPLKDICTFTKVASLERLVKENGETTFYIFANVDASVVTASEALDKLTPTLQEIQKKYKVKLKFKGEREQKRVMQTEMIFASFLAIILIFIAILYLFNSLKETLIVMSVIPFSLLGVYLGHFFMHLNISLPSLIGALGLAGVIVNDGIIMMDTIRKAKSKNEIFVLASRRLRPIIITSLTTIVGLSSLMFFATAEAAVFQPLAVSMGFGLLWGTILNLIYLPTLYLFSSGKRLLY